MPRPHSPTFVALLAGGRGVRFWPLSRHLRPKQFLDITGEGPLLRLTAERARGLCPPGNLLLVTSEALAADSRRLAGVTARNVLAEPVGRNTAAAVGLACAVAAARDERAVVIAMPADHHVAKPARLRAILRRAAAAAARLQAPVLLGIPPESARSDFGYIVPERRAARGARTSDPLVVRRFVEKPAAARARSLIRQGALWNSGIFVLPAVATLAAIRHRQPLLGRALEKLPARRDGAAFTRALRGAWPGLPAVSFDSGVIESWADVRVLPAADIGWSDVGSWEAVAAGMPADEAGNQAQGPAFFVASAGCLAVQRDPSRTIVIAGARDLVVVDAGDVIFAAPRSDLAHMREIVEAVDRARPELS